MTALFAALCILTFPYIDLGASLPLGGWTLDAPIADLAAAVLIPLAALGLTRENATRFPGRHGYALILVAALLAVPNAIDPNESLHFILRKPVFFYVAYGCALAWVVARALSAPALRGILLLSVSIAAVISIGSSIARITAGSGLWFAAIEGLTNNHKTLAVALAPTLPLVLGLRRGRLDLAVVALALLAIALSMSRTAWIATAIGLSFLVVWRGRPLATRRGLVLGLLLFGVAGAIYGPVLMGSNVQLDAARSRHSLDKRAWAMFTAHPIVGAGAGTNVLYEQQTFPDYRVNGVDAHGVIQKVGSETGALGLVGYALFVAAMGVRLYTPGRSFRFAPQLRLHARATDGAWACFVALHANLLFSTETFSQTHWVPLAIAWGLSERRA